MEKKVKNIASKKSIGEEKEIAGVAGSLYLLFQTEAIIREREKAILLDSMKEFTGGKGFVITNSK